MDILTDKVKLTPPEHSDAEALFRLRAHPAVNKYIHRPLPTNIDDVEHFIEQRLQDANNSFYFIIRTLPGLALAGAICLWNIDKATRYAEVGYELLPEFQGKGLMTSALQAMINFAFTELKIETIEAFTHRENLASRKLLETFSFKEMLGKTDPDNPNNVIYCLQKATT